MPVNVRPDNKAKEIKEKILGVPENQRGEKNRRKKRPPKIDKYIIQEPRSSAR